MPEPSLDTIQALLDKEPEDPFDFEEEGELEQGRMAHYFHKRFFFGTASNILGNLENFQRESGLQLGDVLGCCGPDFNNKFLVCFRDGSAIRVTFEDWTVEQAEAYAKDHAKWHEENPDAEN